MGVNTEQFGTFSPEVERTGSQLDAANAEVARGGLPTADATSDVELL